MSLFQQNQTLQQIPASYVELYPIFRQQNPTSNLLTLIIQAASLFSLKPLILWRIYKISADISAEDLFSSTLNFHLH
jgi:hypothetical protein